MRKCIVTVIAALMLAIACCIGVSAEDQIVYDSIGLLNAIGVASDFDNEKLSEPVSRIDFAVYVAKMLNFDERQSSSMNYFYDVPADHWGKYCLNTLVERHIISGCEEHYFRPDEPVKTVDATAILIRAMGNEYIAGIYGGYPDGYKQTAYKCGLYKNIEVKDTLTYRDMAVLLYNSLNAEISTFNSDMEIVNKGDTLLSVYHKIYSADGIVESVCGASVISKKITDDKQIIISGEEMQNEAYRAYDKLGMKVKYYYRDDDGDKTVIYICDSRYKNEVMEFTSDRYAGYSGGVIRYYKDKNSSQLKSVRISDGVSVVKNGENVSTDIAEALNNFYGNIKIINTGRYNGADIIIIEDYKNIVVSHIDMSNNTVYDKYDNSINVSLEEENGRTIKYFNDEGKNAVFSDISVDSVISVMESESGDCIHVYINDKKITGTINSLGLEEDDPYITIDDVEYEVTEEFARNKKLKLSSGIYCTFKTDIMGKIVYADIDKESLTPIFAYLINGYIDCMLDNETLNDDHAILKLFTENGEMINVICADKMRIDEKVYKNPKEIIKALSDNGGVISQLIRFQYDTNGNINFIDTKKEDSKPYSLHLMENEKRINKHWAGFLGTKAIVDSSVKVMCVPSEGTEKNGEESAFSIKTYTAIPKGPRRIDLFQLDPESLKIDMVVYYSEQSYDISTYSALYVVENIGEGLNSDGEAAHQLVLNATGNSSKFIVSNNYEIRTGGKTYYDPELVSVGDVIRITTDYKNEIRNIQMVFDYSVAEQDGENDFFTNAIKSYRIENGIVPGNFFEGFKMSYGYVSQTDGNLIQWGYAKPGDRDEIYNLSLDSSKAKILVFDREEKKGRAGTASDIVGYYKAASGFSKIITLSESAIISQIIVYN